MQPRGSRPPLDKCTFCGVALAPIWWQRYLVAAIGLILSLVVPAALRIRGVVALLFVAMICIFPALVFAHILVFKTIPPKYVRKREAVMTLFRR